MKCTDGVEYVDHENVKEKDSKVVCSSLIIMQNLKGNAKSNTGFEEGLYLSNSDEL